MGSPYPGYGNYGSLVPSGAFGQIGQVLGGLGASAAQWLPLIGQMMQGQEETAWKGLQIALQSPDANVRRQAIEDYEKRRKSPFHVPWPKVTVPGQVTTPAQPAVPAVPGIPPAPQDINIPEGGLAPPVGGKPAVPAAPEVRAPTAQQYWVPPVDLAQRTYQDVFGNNPKAAGFLTELQREGIPLDVPIGQILANPIMAAQVEQIAKTLTGWGPTTPGVATPGAPVPQPPGVLTVPGAGPASAAGSATPPAPGPAPTIPQVTAPPGQPPTIPQGAAPPGPPAAEAPRINPAIVASAQGKNTFTMTAAEALESAPGGGFALTPKEEAAWGGVPASTYPNLPALQSAVLQRRQQEAQIAAETATAGLRTTEMTGLQATQAAQAAQRQQDYYTNAAFGIMFGDPQNAPARLTRLYAQAEAHGVKPAIVKADAMERLQRAQAGETVPIQLHDSRGTPYRNPDGTPVTIRMTGNEYRQYLQENERTRLLHSAEALGRLKYEMVLRAIKETGDQSVNWPDDIRVLMGLEPKPTSPQAIRKWAIDLLTRNNPFFNTPNKDETPEQLLARQEREVDNIIKLYAPPKPGAETPVPVAPGPPPPPPPGQGLPSGLQPGQTTAGRVPGIAITLPPVGAKTDVSSSTPPRPRPDANTQSASDAIVEQRLAHIPQVPGAIGPSRAQVTKDIIAQFWPNLSDAKRTDLTTRYPNETRGLAGPAPQGAQPPPPATAGGTRSPAPSPRAMGYWRVWQQTHKPIPTDRWDALPLQWRQWLEGEGVGHR